MSYRIFTLVTVVSALFCLTSCKKDSPSADSAEEQAPQSATEPVEEPVVEPVAEEPVATEPVVRTQALALGETAPDFTLSTPDQTPFHLAKQLEEGPVVLLALRGWPGYQCPICTRQVGAFVAQADALEAAGAHVVLVYPGPAEQLVEHAKEFVSDTTLPANFSFVIDSDFGFTNRYGLRWDETRETAYPSTFVIDTQGIVRFAKVSQSHEGRAKMADVLTALGEVK